MGVLGLSDALLRCVRTTAGSVSLCWEPSNSWLLWWITCMMQPIAVIHQDKALIWKRISQKQSFCKLQTQEKESYLIIGIKDKVASRRLKGCQMQGYFYDRIHMKWAALPDEVWWLVSYLRVWFTSALSTPPHQSSWTTVGTHFSMCLCRDFQNPALL